MRKTPARNSEEFHSMRAIPGRSVVRQDSAVPIPMGVDSPTRNSAQVPMKKMATPSRNSEEFHSMRAIPGHSVIRQDTGVPVPVGYGSPNRGSSAFQEKKMSTPSRRSNDFESMRTIPGRTIVRPDSAVPASDIGVQRSSNQPTHLQNSQLSTPDNTEKVSVLSRTVPLCTVIDQNSSAPAPENTFAALNSTRRSSSPSPQRERRQASPSPQRYSSPSPIRSRTVSPSGTIQLTPSERRCSCCSRLASQLDEFHRKPSPKKMTPPVSRSPSPAPYVVITRDPSPAPASADRQRVVNAPTPETVLGRSGLPPFSPQRSSLRDSQRDWDDYSFDNAHSIHSTHSTGSTYSGPQIEVEGLPDMTVTGMSVPLLPRSPLPNNSANTTDSQSDEPERQTFTVRRNYEDRSKPTERAESPNRYHNGSAARAERHRSSPSPSVDHLGSSFDALQYADTPVHAPPARPVIPMDPLLPARPRDPYTDFATAEKGVWVPSSPLHGTSFNRNGCPYLTRCRTPSPSPTKSQLSIIVDIPAKKVAAPVAKPVVPAVVIKPYVDNRDMDSISVATPSSKPARKSASFTPTAAQHAEPLPPAPVVPQLPAQIEGPSAPVTPSAGAQLDVLHKVQAHGNIHQLNLSQQAPPHAPVYVSVPPPAPSTVQQQQAPLYAPSEVSQQALPPAQTQAQAPIQPPAPQYVQPPVQYAPPPQVQQIQQTQHVQPQYVPQTPQASHAPPPQEMQYVYAQHPQGGVGSVAGGGSIHSVVYSTPPSAPVFSPLTQTPSVQYVQQTIQAPPSPMYYPQPAHAQYPAPPSVHSAQYSQPATQYMAPPQHYLGGAPPQHYAPPSPGYVQYPPSVQYPVQYVPVPVPSVQYVQMPPSPVQYVYAPHGIDTWYNDMQRR